ncbi:cysteine methyltransferase [Tenacibaculum discolor]|uniref:Methylated-DNA--protein-cysteine methyltransferase n=1 Tax=Tenacibaculum discolor TaxID=361581 RepID=A0A2G1BW67_9FLAO|nr:methylated-DNA--[protein]-cysteine S-methyltransferase [Tenacibaculum sp.]PHN98266.1 cysteine methyltransferase [Tenacibaculum discolor]PHN99846.1 cysteine methyltransferase [Rhodobacteraceae bacterium 4F10]
MKFRKLLHRILKTFLVFNLQTTYYKTPIGIAKIEGDENGIQSISVLNDDTSTSLITSNETPTCLQDCVTQLNEYFTGTRKEFDLKLNPQGTTFQQSVWNELLHIPFGSTRTYLEQTKQLGDVKAIRAVASANGKNPIWIIIPCHRVVGSDGSLTGYAGGIWRKKWLLEHESGAKQQTLF